MNSKFSRCVLFFLFIINRGFLEVLLLFFLLLFYHQMMTRLGGDVVFSYIGMWFEFLFVSEREDQRFREQHHGDAEHRNYQEQKLNAFLLRLVLP